MRNLVISLAFSLLLVGCQRPPAAPGSPPDAQPAAPEARPAEPVIPKNGIYQSKGVVTKVNLPGSTIELDHEDIPGVMPKMRMEFYVKDPQMLKGIKIGDSVDFELEYKHPTETVVNIKKTPQ